MLRRVAWPLLVLMSLAPGGSWREAAALTPEGNCQYCQRILYFSYTHFKKQTTKRFLRHKVNHLCKRYSDYRRHCLTSVLPRVEVIWMGMEQAVLAGAYKPWTTCETIKECDKNQSPMEFKELARVVEQEEDPPTTAAADPTATVAAAAATVLANLDDETPQNHVWDRSRPVDPAARPSAPARTTSPPSGLSNAVLSHSASHRWRLR